MNRLLATLLLIFYLQSSSAQKPIISKDSFLLGVQHSFNEVHVRICCDEPGIIWYTDTAFQLPPAQYRASVVISSPNKSDTLYFYFYPIADLRKAVPKVLESSFQKQSLRYNFESPLVDSSGQFLLIFFFPKEYDSLQEKNLKQSLISHFKTSEMTISLVEIKGEESTEPPPPPPPKKGVNKTGGINQ